MPIPVDQFGKTVVASGLLTADEVKKIWSDLTAEERPKDGERFAKLLVDRKKLTPFQAYEILAGRGARLVLGEYSIISQIGAGGMGQVFKAQHRRMKRIVALKVMSNAAMKDAAAVKRFQREVEAAARLEHPNIVTAYDSGDSANLKYLVMQFVDGGDLSDLVKYKGRLSVEKAIGYMLQAARGLAYAHTRGVIHRDIKPANLLLHKDGTIKVLDMGLARMEDSGEITGSEQVMGTVDYMSPEQASDLKNVDARADIYGLGCTLWYLLVGRKMYEGDTIVIRLMKHRDAPLPSLVKERDDVSWPLEQAFHKMVAKRKEDRYQSMDDVIAALAPFAESADSVLSSSSNSGSPRSAEMASFMQAMGSGVGLADVTHLPTKPNSGARLDTTPNVRATEVDADRGRVAPSKGSSSNLNTRAAARSGATASFGPRQKLIAIGAVVVAALAIVVGIVVVSLPEGEKKIAGPETAVNGNPASSPIATMPTPRTPGAPTTAPVPARPSPSADAVVLESSEYAWTPPENLGATINSEHDEESPSLTDDELRLVFHRRGRGISGNMEARRASVKEPFGEPVRISGPPSSDPYLSSDGLTLVYASPGGELFMRSRSSRESGWSPPYEFESPINSSQDDRQPWISSDLLTLAFSSERPGGFGDADIWISRRRSTNESFGPPENAGKGINTPQDDDDPRILADGRTMLFSGGTSRNRRLNLSFVSPTGIVGALALHDIPPDVRDPWLSADGKRMYFQSLRPGGFGEYDLYVMRRVKKTELAAESAIPTFPPAGTKPATSP